MTRSDAHASTERGLLGALALARGTYDRAGQRRDDPRYLADVWSGAAAAEVLVLHDAHVLVDDEGLVLHQPTAFADVDGTRVLLGQEDGVALLGLLTPVGGPPPVPSEVAEQQEAAVRPRRLPRGEPRWAGLREIGAALGDRDSSLLVTAQALANWHTGAAHCPRCGAATEVINAGWARRCPHDGSEHFPRNDPAVIVLVLDAQDRALLGHRAGWPDPMYSTLAGFVEAGESAELTVVREMAEEAGVRIDPASLRYLGSQPWPFPSSLMLGFHARVAADSPPAAADGVEIGEVRWFTRDELAAAFASRALEIPGRVSIARRLIERWYGAPLQR